MIIRAAIFSRFATLQTAMVTEKDSYRASRRPSRGERLHYGPMARPSDSIEWCIVVRLYEAPRQTLVSQTQNLSFVGIEKVPADKFKLKLCAR